MLGGGGGGDASNASTTANANNDPFGLNLGNGGNNVIPSVKQKQQQPPSQQKDLAALVGGVDDPFGVVPAQQQQRKRFLEPTVNVEECVRKLVSQDSGVLYEDTELQIGIKSNGKVLEVVWRCISETKPRRISTFRSWTTYRK